MDSIQSVSGIAQTQVQKYNVDRVYSRGDDGHKVQGTTYTVTLYDSNGILTSVTNSHQINYLI